MEIKELRQIGFRYVRIRLDGQNNRYENINFTNLLLFIGKHYPINDRNPIGCAYTVIRRRTDKLLHVSWNCNWKLKTSKKEISSIRFAKFWPIENTDNHYYIRIPYKISFIFTAIINIVSELSEQIPIPSSLDNCLGVAYGLSFYAFHMEQYDHMYRRQFRDDAKYSDSRKNPAKLYNDFHSPNNVFQQVFNSI